MNCVTSTAASVIPERPAARRCRRKFLRFFPGGFRDPDYVESERAYKWILHEDWQAELGRSRFGSLVRDGAFREIADRAVRIEARRSLLFSYEKMALRDAVRSPAGARAFATGLYDFLYGRGTTEARFERWCETVAALPRKQGRVFTWPVVTVFGFLAEPRVHIFLKPTVTRIAAREYGYDFAYRPGPSWPVYADYLELAALVEREQRDLGPRDMIDIQSFLWVQGSDEYAED
jgi:hypothetical protein